MFRGDCAEYGLVVLDISDLESGVKYGIIDFPVRYMAEVSYHSKEGGWDPVEDPRLRRSLTLYLSARGLECRCLFFSGYANTSTT